MVDVAAEDQLAGWGEPVSSLIDSAQELLELEPARALEQAERALQHVSRADRPALAARILCLLARARVALGRYADAAAAVDQGLALADAAGAKPLRIELLRVRVKHAFFARDHETAIVAGSDALQLSREIGDRRAEAIASNDLGLVYGFLQAYDEALEHLLAGLKILQEIGEQALGSHLNNIGNVYLEQNDPVEALAFFRSARDSFRSHQPGRGEAIALGNVARAQASAGNSADAVLAARESLALFQQLGATAYLPPALARLAEAHAVAGETAAARTRFDEAMSALRAAPELEFEDDVLRAVGEFHVGQGEPGLAIPCLRRALERCLLREEQRRTPAIHRLLAEAYEAQGEYEIALQHVKEQQRIEQLVLDIVASVKMQRLMLQLDLERARQQEEIFRLQNVELASAYRYLQALHEKLAAKNRELQQISIEDALTGLYNRRYLDIQLDHEISRTRRRQRPLCVAMCDIDHFKTINDLYSQVVGDEVLRVVGGLLKSNVRREDVVARFGGEEFLVVLPETTLEDARIVAERLRTAVGRQPWPAVHPELQVTLSIGIAALEGGEGPRELIAAADARLYDAKRAGRNAVCA